MQLWRVRRAFSRPVAIATVIAALLVWVSGFFYLEVKVWMYAPEEVLTVACSGRALCVRRWDYQPGIDSLLRTERWTNPAAVPQTFWPTERWVKWGWLGPNLRWSPNWLAQFNRREFGWIFTIPWWIFAAAGILFLVLLRVIPSRGRCRFCGYDLRGLPSDICPECGSRFKQAPIAIPRTPAS